MLPPAVCSRSQAGVCSVVTGAEADTLLGERRAADPRAAQRSRRSGGRTRARANVIRCGNARPLARHRVGCATPQPHAARVGGVGGAASDDGRAAAAQGRRRSSRQRPNELRAPASALVSSRQGAACAAGRVLPPAAALALPTGVLRARPDRLCLAGSLRALAGFAKCTREGRTPAWASWGLRLAARACRTPAADRAAWRRSLAMCHEAPRVEPTLRGGRCAAVGRASCWPRCLLCLPSSRSRRQSRRPRRCKCLWPVLAGWGA